MALRQASYTLTGSDTLRLFSTCVYAWKRQGRFLYIGCTSNGIGRVKCHNIIHRADKIQPTDEISFWWFDNFDDAAAFELEMIKAHKPKYAFDSLAIDNLNPRACIVCGRVFNPKRRWQKYCRPKCGQAVSYTTPPTV